MGSTEDVLEGLGAVRLAAGRAPGAAPLRVDPARAGEFAALVFPSCGRGYRLRLALTGRLGVDPLPGLAAIAARGPGELGAELDRLARLEPLLGAALRLRAAGAEWLLAGVRPAGAAAGPDASPDALARWAALPYERSLRAYLALLAERPSLPALLSGTWSPNAALSVSSAWPPDARARLAQLAGV